MFGLSSREVLIKAIKNACQNELHTYRSGLESLLEKPEEEQEHYAIKVRKDYFNAVFDSLWNSFGVSSPIVGQRLRIVLTNPGLSGLPPEFSLEYLDSIGISAGVTFAFCYYALTNKPIGSTKHFRDMSALNHYQVACMSKIIDEYNT